MERDPTRVVEIVEEGMTLLEREREVLRAGDFPAVSSITSKKTDLLARLETAMRGVRRTAVIVEAVEALISESRRNEGMIRAALQGLAAAKRRIAAIIATGKGAVAYAEDGSRIKSRADATRATKRA